MATTTKSQVIRLTADDDSYAPGHGRILIKGIRLVAGVDAATALIKENDTSGAVVCSLKAPADGTDECTICFTVGVPTIHVDLTGTSSEVYIYLG